MNNLKSARELKFQNFIKDRIKTCSKVSSSCTSRQQSVNKTKTEHLTSRSKQTVHSTPISIPALSTSFSTSILRRNLAKHNINHCKYYIKLVNDMIYDEKKHVVSVFKDYLMWDENSDFLKRFYHISESVGRLPKICGYYEKYTLMSPVYFKLTCIKIMLKNMKKHKKLLEIIEENEDLVAGNNDLAHVSDSSNHYSKLIQTSVNNYTQCSKIDKAEDKKNVIKNLSSSSSLSLNCNEISKKCDRAENYDIATLSNIIANLSLNTSDKKENEPMTPHQPPSPHLKGYCDTEGHTITSPSQNSPITLNSKLQINKNTVKTHEKNLKRIEIKKLDLKNINHIAEEKMPLTQLTESKRIFINKNYLSPKLFTNPLSPSNYQNRKLYTYTKPSPCICFNSEYMKNNFNSIESMFKVLQIKGILNNSSTKQKKTDTNLKTIQLSTKAKIMRTIKQIIKESKMKKNATPERDSEKGNNQTIKNNIQMVKSNKNNSLFSKNVTSIKKRMVPEFTKKSLKNINTGNALFNYSKQAPVMNKQSTTIISSGPNTTPSSIYNINLNLNLNLNLNMPHNRTSINSYQVLNNQSRSKSKSKPKSKSKTNVHEQAQSLASALFNTRSKIEKLFSPHKTGNQIPSRNIHDKKICVNYQSGNSKQNSGKSRSKIQKKIVVIPGNNCINKCIGGIPLIAKNMQSIDIIKNESKRINYNKAILSKKRKSINLTKNTVNKNFVDVSRKYPLTSRNEREIIPQDIWNKIASSHK